MILLFVALAYFSYSRFVLDASRQDEVDAADTSTLIDDSSGAEPEITEFNKSIVVLPFMNMSSDDEQEYFSDGISEELLNLLAKIPELRVISRTSAFYYKGKNATIEEISNELNVAYVLEGSVRKSGNQLRITAQLIDARTDTHLWSETYDRELRNIFAVQDEISAAIVDALKDSLELQVETIPRVAALINTEAHDAYLRGRHLLLQRTRSSIEGAVKNFERAIEIHPGYALAHAELAIANLLLSRIPGAYGDLMDSEAQARALPHAEQALKLDPSLAEAQAAMGLVLKRQGHFEQALDHYRRAIEINPSYSDAYTWLGFLLYRDLGNYVEGIAVREQALRYDPLSRPAIINYMGILLRSDRFDEASRELEKIATVYPDIYAIWKGNKNGRLADRVLGYLSAMKIANGLRRTPLTSLSYTFARLGLEDEALALFNPPLSSTLSILGRHEGAVAVANERVLEDPTSLNNLGLQAQALASGGYYTRARPVLENLWQQGNKKIASLATFEFDDAVALTVIRQAADAQTEELVMAIDDHVRRLREVGNIRRANYEAGIAAFLTGDRMAALGKYL
jgi:TolB-like protein/Tfp pilus assembly protein PilF